MQVADIKVKVNNIEDLIRPRKPTFPLKNKKALKEVEHKWTNDINARQKMVSVTLFAMHFKISNSHHWVTVHNSLTSKQTKHSYKQKNSMQTNKQRKK